MHHETGKRVGLALLTGAFALRLLTGAGATPAPAAPARVYTVKVETKQAPAEPEPVYLEFTEAEAENILLSGVSTDADKAALLTEPLELAPAVLIYHTHTSEAYAQSAGWTYRESDPLRTTDSSHSVAAVGAKAAEVLRARGVQVIHDVTFYDHPDYNSAYYNARASLQSLLAAHPEVSVVLDLHRDAILDDRGNALRQVTELPDGQAAAKLMLVVGTDAGGQHPNWQKNLSLALKVQAAAERRQPGICKAMDLRRERFNQFLSPGALLVEVGSAGNTLPEALLSAEILANAVADLLVGVSSADTGSSAAAPG